jgi:hypothetical protein
MKLLLGVLVGVLLSCISAKISSKMWNTANEIAKYIKNNQIFEDREAYTSIEESAPSQKGDRQHTCMCPSLIGEVLEKLLQTYQDSI